MITSAACASLMPAPARAPSAPFDLVRRSNLFWSRVDRRGQHDCWPWLGSRNRAGYGQFWAGAKAWPASKVAALLANKASDQRGVIACHRCDNPPCCNPDHLFLGSYKDNTADMMAKGRARNGRRRSA